MARRRRQNREDQIEEAIREADSIGKLERLAGIGQTLAERTEFWLTFCRLPGAEGLDAGVAELKRRIRSGGTPSNP